MKKNIFLCTVFVVLTVSTSAQNNVPDTFIRINGGTFMMGSPADESERDDQDQHQVTVSAFYMGKYEVTQKEYEEVMGTNPSRFKGPNLPVENVSWFDAVVLPGINTNPRNQTRSILPL
jgi:formylglycine-generating enzyme required for sulfatase activity